MNRDTREQYNILNYSEVQRKTPAYTIWIPFSAVSNPQDCSKSFVHFLESAGGVVVTTSACHAADAGGTGSIPGTGSDIKIWLSTLVLLMSVPSQFGT